MKKTVLKAAVAETRQTTGEALQLLWDSINQGQRKQLAKRTEIKSLLERYGVSV